MIRVKIEIEMPNEELEPFMKAFRGWERGREEIRAAMKFENDGMPMRDAIEIFESLEPPLPVGRIIEKKDMS